MKQYTETYRIKVSPDTRKLLDELKPKYKITPSKFIRNAIVEKLKHDIPKLHIENNKEYCPF